LKAHRTVSSNSYAAFQPEIAAFLDEHRCREILIIAAVRGAADDLVWTTNGPGLIGVHRFTLTQVAVLLASNHLAEKRRKIASAFVSEAIAARVAYELCQKRSWKYFGDVVEMPGFPKALATTLAELRFNTVKPSELRKVSVVGEDLSIALREYEHQLEISAIADLPEIYTVATKVAREAQHRLLDLPVVLLDVPIRTKCAGELLEALLPRSPQVLACTLSRDKAANAAIDSIRSEEAKTATETDERTTIARIRSSLFELQPPAQHLVDDTLDYFSAPGEAMESVEIARRVIKLAESGMAFDRIAVLLRAPDQYEPLLEEALRRAAIPAYFSRGVVRPDPAGRAFLALLACAMEDCSASRFAEYLSLAQVPSLGQRTVDPAVVDDEVHAALRAGIQEQSGENVQGDDVVDDTASVIEGTLQTPAHWEHLIVNASVIGGAERWERRLNALGAELRLKIERAGGSESEQAYLEAELTRLENLKAFALPLITALHDLPSSAPWSDWLAALRELAQMSLRRPGGVLAILDELLPMSDVGPVGLQEVFLVLSDRLRFLRRESTLRRHGRVFVGAIEESRGRIFDVVFVPGLAEGLFPRKVMEDPLLLDVHRQEGNLRGRLITNSERIEQERLLLSVALASATKQFTFSFPRIDIAQSRPRVPSLYALETIRAAHGHLPELRSFQEQAADRAPSRLDHPAPREFQDAIDDPEYDLVALDRAVHKSNKNVKAGAMAYLTRVSEPLARSLRARYSQWEVRKWTPYDGLIISEPDVKPVLQAHRLSARPYSATALQAYATCPYRFVLLGIHGLRPRDTIQPLTQMDAMTRGALFHDVQREFFVRAKERGLLPAATEGLDTCRQLLDAALDDVEEHYRERLAPAINRVWRAEIEEIRTDLHGWLEEAVRKNEWLPEHFELGFGLPATGDRDPSSCEQAVALEGGILVRGAIDLVERHMTRGTLRVVDHKTGKAPDRPFLVLGGGSALQPLLYGLAAEQVLSAPVESGRLFYCTQRGSYRELEVPLTSESRVQLNRALEIIDQAIASGLLPAVPNRDACQFCDCRCACGPHEELRWKRKPPLDELTELRNMP
jgi:ATP-dependent helicase/nuclease subunit B